MEVRGEQSRQGAKVSCQDRLCIEEEEEELAYELPTNFIIIITINAGAGAPDNIR